MNQNIRTLDCDLEAALDQWASSFKGKIKDAELIALQQKQLEGSRISVIEAMSNWKSEIKGIATEGYISDCTRLSTINYDNYLRFLSKSDGSTKSQAHRDWKDTIDHLLQYLHWATQKRKQSAKLQSVALMSLADASVNNNLKQILREELSPGAAASNHSDGTSSLLSVNNDVNDVEEPSNAVQQVDELKYKNKILERDLGMALEEWANSLDDGSSERTLISKLLRDNQSLRGQNKDLESKVTQLQEESSVLLRRVARLQNEVHQERLTAQMKEKEKDTEKEKEKEEEEEKKVVEKEEKEEKEKKNKKAMKVKETKMKKK
ncbi:hypothetical protein BGZ76_004530 [Entomortierella beljakovae]|nr:hypothetical protein BGZ76_004530 [Entomortierella beljakovae]